MEKFFCCPSKEIISLNQVCSYSLISEELDEKEINRLRNILIEEAFDKYFIVAHMSNGSSFRMLTVPILRCIDIHKSTKVWDVIYEGMAHTYMINVLQNIARTKDIIIKPWDKDGLLKQISMAEVFREVKFLSDLD